MISGVNIISGRVSVAGFNGAGGAGDTLSPSARDLGVEPLRKFLGSKEHLDWLKMDLDVV